MTEEVASGDESSSSVATETEDVDVASDCFVVSLRSEIVVVVGIVVVVVVVVVGVDDSGGFVSPSIGGPGVGVVDGDCDGTGANVQVSALKMKPLGVSQAQLEFEAVLQSFWDVLVKPNPIKSNDLPYEAIIGFATIWHHLRTR